jgi:hypothetical protein
MHYVISPFSTRYTYLCRWQETIDVWNSVLYNTDKTARNGCLWNQYDWTKTVSHLAFTLYKFLSSSSGLLNTNKLDSSLPLWTLRGSEDVICSLRVSLLWRCWCSSSNVEMLC